jgi:hypothetical protein
MKYMDLPTKFPFEPHRHFFPSPSSCIPFVSLYVEKQNLEKTIYTVLGENCMCFSYLHYSKGEGESNTT